MKNWNDCICPKVVTIFRLANILKDKNKIQNEIDRLKKRVENNQAGLRREKFTFSLRKQKLNAKT